MRSTRSANVSPWRRLAALLGVWAVLVRCVIAPGLMPDPAAAAHGAFKLVICTGTGLKTLPAHPDGNPAPADDHGQSALCPYAASGHVAAASALAPLASPEARPVLAPPAYRDSPAAFVPRLRSARAPPCARSMLSAAHPSA